MSDKQAKKVRKQINNLLYERMDRQQPNMSLSQLETYVQLSVFLTGKKPEVIELVAPFYNYYIQEVQHQAECMGLDAGFKGDKPTFLGIPLEKKVEIAIAK